MGCCGQHKTKYGGNRPDSDARTLPTDECVLCAEKHLATAYALASENGYKFENRAAIVGQLCLCQWHCYHAEPKLAGSIRAARHLIQQRREAEVDWHPLLTAMDALAAAEASKILEQQPTDKKEA